MPGNTNYVKLDLLTGNVYTQARCRHMETQAESLTSPGAQFIGPEFQGYKENTGAPSISSNTLTLDLSTTNNFEVNLTANINTLTINNVPASGKLASFTIKFKADGSLRTITWPASVKWPSASAPTMTSTNNKIDILTFLSYDGGTTWYGFVGGQNF